MVSEMWAGVYLLKNLLGNEERNTWGQKSCLATSIFLGELTGILDRWMPIAGKVIIKVMTHRSCP